MTDGNRLTCAPAAAGMHASFHLGLPVLRFVRLRLLIVTLYASVGPRRQLYLCIALFAISETIPGIGIRAEPPPRSIAWDGAFYDEHVPTTYTYEPTGMLSLAITSVGRLGVQTTWSDGKRERLESRLTELVSRLSAVALAVKLRRVEEERQRVAALEEAERRRIAEIEAERRRWARQQHRWAEEEREKKLLGELDRWRLARDVREYVDDKVWVVSDHQGVGEMSLAIPARSG